MNTDTNEIIGKAVLETLERRQMMSAVSFKDGILVVQGLSAAPNNLTINLSPDGASVWGVANGETGAPVAVSQVRQIRIIGGDGDDMVHVDPRVMIPVYIRTGNGDDNITAGAGREVILAGSGNDTIMADGKDILHDRRVDDRLLGMRGNNLILS